MIAVSSIFIIAVDLSFNARRNYVVGFSRGGFCGGKRRIVMRNATKEQYGLIYKITEKSLCLIVERITIIPSLHTKTAIERRN